GDRLHAVLPRSLFNRWRGVLKEFHSYNMKWFIVSEDKLKSKSTDIDMFLTFRRLTQVTHVSKPDVVAQVVGREDPRDMLTKTGKELKRMVIVIEDTGILSSDHSYPWIVWKTSIQSNFLLSKVNVNPDLEEVVAYRESLMNGGTAASSRISHISTQAVASALEELTQTDASVMKIENVIKCSKECKPWIAGQIVALNNGMDDWYYDACGNCGKKVEPELDGRYECTNEKCHHIGKNPKFKYKVQVMVYDGTTCINLLLWDTHVINLCGKRADEVANEDMEEFGYPPTLDGLIENEDLVKQFLPEDFMSQQTATVTEMDSSNSPEQSQAVVNLHIDADDHDSLAAGEDSESTKTPAKRPIKEIKSGHDGSYEHDVEGQLSTNKFSRRGGKKGKL
ncbi:hypothetical protein PIB30_101067, partial [Stylosanthes scabra]|nr:hypothetical protein [Stylosanthes scabra]